MKQTACDLQSCFLCRTTIADWKELIAVKKKTISVPKGKTILSEGAPVQGIYFIFSGSAKVSKNWGEQKELIVRFARRGNVLGLRGFGESVYPVSAVALEDSKICFIDNALFETVLHTNPSFTYELMKVYAAELQHAEKKMRDLVHSDAKGRIAAALLEIAAIFGTNPDHFISVAISRQDIASFAGTTYETIFKFFNELIEQKILFTSGKNIRIGDEGRLRNFIQTKELTV